MPHAVPYLKALTWGLPPLLLFVALRRYLQATGHVQPIMIALISANVVNFLAAWALIFGRWGLPSMGAAGAGWATCISRVYLLVFIIAYIVRRECRQGTGLHQSRRRIDPDRMRRLLTLGFPAATQLSLEVGVFALATVLVGRMGAKPLAAHQVALVAISFIFMVPLGISSAGAVRVGQNLGRGRADAAGLAGWTALLCTAGFMALSAGCLSLFPRLILEGFTNDREVIEWGVKLLRVAAVFQLFDGLQVVATGVLRGLGETRTPMIANIVGHWVLGLPVGSWLAFSLGLGVVGLWSGLCLGLITCGLTLLFVWGRRCGRMPAGVLRPISQT
jgi:MATE family multidrug resistance protein